jgi:hypothetical protein
MAGRKSRSEPSKEPPRTKRELAEQSDGDESGGERYGRGAPTEHPEQFEEFTDTEPESSEDDEAPAP